VWITKGGYGYFGVRAMTLGSHVLFPFPFPNHSNHSQTRKGTRRRIIKRAVPVGAHITGV
jgi:hypothetical protein